MGDTRVKDTKELFYITMEIFQALNGDFANDPLDDLLYMLEDYKEGDDSDETN